MYKVEYYLALLPIGIFFIEHLRMRCKTIQTSGARGTLNEPNLSRERPRSPVFGRTTSPRTDAHDKKLIQHFIHGFGLANRTHFLILLYP